MYQLCFVKHSVLMTFEESGTTPLPSFDPQEAEGKGGTVRRCWLRLGTGPSIVQSCQGGQGPVQAWEIQWKSKAHKLNL